MLDTIIYIPTILAYTFITLLVIILGFIVVYISHKIYLSVYDNLPVSQSALATMATILSKESNASSHHSNVAPVRGTGNFILTKHDSFVDSSKKTVQR